ncbi:uncharacterized protein METZ01_LOCUS274467 [marine metagenome]|uniref:Outer membrane lipoprotein BamD-like domain-containing protein n=1 Tax=marine metagenome TaxID=408172 RepID=A0A382KDM3_9ZZZZ
MLRCVRYLFFCITVIELTGCGPPRPTSEWGVEELYDYGQRHYEGQDYLRSMEAFRIITLNYTTSEMIDDAMFYLGESYRQMKEYPVSSVTYRRLMRDFPQSPYADDAQYNLARSVFAQSSSVEHTQDKTFEAIRELQIFLDEYPDSEVAPDVQRLLQECLDKLAEKDYQIGHLYFKLQDWNAARVYFTEVIDEFPTSQWSILARYELGESFAREENWDEAVMNLQVFLELYPGHELALTVKDRLREIVPKSSSAPEKTDSGSRFTKDGNNGLSPQSSESKVP